MDFVETKIKSFLDVNLLKGNKKQLWVNPDCGLKTREWSQVGTALLLHRKTLLVEAGMLWRCCQCCMGASLCAPAASTYQHRRDVRLYFYTTGGICLKGGL